MSIRSQLILVGLIVAILSAWLYGQHQYKKGAADTRVEYVLARISLEQEMQYEADLADAKYRDAIQDTKTAEADLAAAIDDLNSLRSASTSNPKVANSGSRPNDTGTDWVSGFAACYQEYANLAKDAAGWADQVNGLQGYVRAIRAE